jgi:signal transduction histidine kinase
MVGRMTLGVALEQATASARVLERDVSVAQDVGSVGSLSALKVRRLLVQFIISGLVAVGVLAALSIGLSRRSGTKEAIYDASDRTVLLAKTVVEPQLLGEPFGGDARAFERLDRTMRNLVLREPLVHARLWDTSGQILYSDDPAQIGRTYPLRDDARHALDTNSVQAEVNPPDAADNNFGSEGKLLEVYVPLPSPNGGQLLFETYHRYDTVNQNAGRIWLTFMPVTLVALVLLQIIQIPLAGRLARGLRSAQQEREQLLRRALQMSDDDRRTIAADIHDGAVQDLSGVVYSLAVVADRVDRAGDGRSALALRTSVDDTRRAIRSLRSLFVEIYPPNLQDTGLAVALSDLVAPLAGRGIQVVVDVPDELRLPLRTTMLVYRTAQEALRNIVKHAKAANAIVTVQVDDDEVQLLVVDDGIGFHAEEDPASGPATGHFGLRLITDLVGAVGGTVWVESEPSAGTTVDVRVPLT